MEYSQGKLIVAAANVLNTAMKYCFDTHAVFTKAFLTFSLKYF
ncbi:MAG: hypothetical protein PHI65_08310 [Firmicutes bacterium]|nr:hypothetical protein [Bacillota bacterium]